jgi:hypothetical protein
VTRSVSHRWTLARAVFLTFAVLALAVKVMIPAGYMAAPSANSSMPFALVLCTAQGAKVVEPGEVLDQDHKAPADNARHDSPCAFAGHGAAALAPNSFTVATVTFATYMPLTPVRVTYLAPGRGLAAPPLPARGPPSQLI